MSDSRLIGIVLAAGAGRRYGGPKALARDEEGRPWLALAAERLRAGGCGETVAVLGCGAEEARPLAPAGCRIVVAEEWRAGLSASLRAGLSAAALGDARAAIVVPVDTPGLPVEAVRRVIAAAALLETALVRAVVAGAPSHPVLLGRAHWHPLAAGLGGDRGAGPYLAAHRAQEVECGDLWDGADIDTR